MPVPPPNPEKPKGQENNPLNRLIQNPQGGMVRPKPGPTPPPPNIPRGFRLFTRKPQPQPEQTTAPTTAPVPTTPPPPPAPPEAITPKTAADETVTPVQTEPEKENQPAPELKHTQNTKKGEPEKTGNNGNNPEPVDSRKEENKSAVENEPKRDSNTTSIKEETPTTEPQGTEPKTTTREKPRGEEQKPTEEEDQPEVKSVIITNEDEGSGGNYSIADFDRMIAHCIEIEASDLHLKANHLPKARSNLEVVPIKGFEEVATEKDVVALSKNLIERNESTAEGVKRHFQKEGWADFAFNFRGSATRGAVFTEAAGTGMVLRFFYAKFVSLNAIGMEHIIPHLNHDAGLILLTGPTGSGKTTLANAMLEHINEREKVHIATMEDPVEYALSEKTARITQRSVPTHVRSFGSGLKSILRQDPDVVFLGEIRDRDVMENAIAAGESGHLVISTLHASSVCDTIHRIINLFPADKERQIRNSLASTHLLIVNQRLIRGIHGKALAHEIFFNTEGTRSTIRTGDINTLENTMLTTKSMVHWDRWLAELYVKKKITKEVFDENTRDIDTASNIMRQMKASGR